MPRLADVLLSLIALLVLSPLLALIACLILLSMGRPVLFHQTRVGHAGHPFTIVKFRSLAADGTPTPVGAILRRMSLDELPEFWNVLRGDMALVGPRPLIAEDQPRLPRIRAARQSVRPGITGWAQVKGRNALTFERSYVLDLWYLRHRSLWLDLYILLLTGPVVASGHGACGLAKATRVRLPRQHRSLNPVRF